MQESDIWKVFAGLDHFKVLFSQSSLVVKQCHSHNPVCYEVTAKRYKGFQNEPLTHCLQLGDDFWYGGAEIYKQRWPIIVNTDIKDKSQVVKFYLIQSLRFRDFPDAPGSVLER